jgi:DNA-binding CsgD family transcriptional regulator
VSAWLPRMFSCGNIRAHSREVALIALISSGKSGRAISQALGVGMPKIRQYCSRIHGKIGTHSRLGIGLWAIRKGMVKSAVTLNPVSHVRDPYKMCPRHASRLLSICAL